MNEEQNEEEIGEEGHESAVGGRQVNAVMPSLGGFREEHDGQGSREGVGKGNGVWEVSMMWGGGVDVPSIRGVGEMLRRS